MTIIVAMEMSRNVLQCIFNPSNGLRRFTFLPDTLYILQIPVPQLPSFQSYVLQWNLMLSILVISVIFLGRSFRVNKKEVKSQF